MSELGKNTSGGGVPLYSGRRFARSKMESEFVRLHGHEPSRRELDAFIADWRGTEARDPSPTNPDAKGDDG